jgi:hypothetical protein
MNGAPQARSRWLIDDLEQRLRAPRRASCRAAAVILYALKPWPALLRYCDDGTIKIDNSAVERACAAWPSPPAHQDK